MILYYHVAIKILIKYFTCSNVPGFAIDLTAAGRISIYRLRDHTSDYTFLSTINVPLNTWVFVAFTIDCQSGIARIFIDKIERGIRNCECPSTVLTTGAYMPTTGANNWRLSCMQIYRRSLNQAEIEQAAMCPWQSKAFAIFS